MILTAVEGGGGGGGLTNLKHCYQIILLLRNDWRELSTPQKLTLLLCDD